MQRDDYWSFTELAKNEREQDYKVFSRPRGSEVIIIAPHGGGIEPGTSEIAEAIAGDNFSLYCFEGLKANCNKILHIKSINFDEPKCI